MKLNESKQSRRKVIGYLMITIFGLSLFGLLEIYKTVSDVNKRYKTLERARELYYYREHLAALRYQTAMELLETDHYIRRMLAREISRDQFKDYSKKSSELWDEVSHFDSIIRELDFDKLSESSSYSGHNTCDYTYKFLDDTDWQTILSHVEKYKSHSGGEQ